MKSAALSLALLTLPVHADDLRRARIEAIASQSADLATTGAGLALGAVEANPLGVFLLPAKAIAYHRIKASPESEQPAMWSAYSAFGWGAAANNLCVIGAILTGGTSGPLCLAVGAGVGWWQWRQDKPARDRAQFEQMCDEARAVQPDLVCRFNGEAA